MSHSIYETNAVTDQMLQEALKTAQAHFDALTPKEQVSHRTVQILGTVTAEMFPDKMDNEVYTSTRLAWFQKLHTALETRDENTLAQEFNGDIFLLVESDYKYFTDNVGKMCERYQKGLEEQEST